MKMPISRQEIADDLNDLRKKGVPEDVVKKWDSLWKGLEGLYKQVEIIQGEQGALRKQSEELSRLNEDIREIRRGIEELKKREWPVPDPGQGAPLRKPDALALPPPTHDAPDRVQ